MNYTNFKDIPASELSSGIPNSHLGCQLSSFQNKYKDSAFFMSLLALTNLLLDMNLETSPRYVLLCGSPGCGKTHYMVGLFRSMVAKLGYCQGDGPLFIPFSVLASEMIGMFKEKVPLRVGLGEYEEARWLFIDDFTSSERVLKEGSLEYITFRDLLIDRYDKNYTLITSCNFHSSEVLTELDRLFGGYVTSRLSQSKIIQFPDVDLRKVQK